MMPLEALRHAVSGRAQVPIAGVAHVRHYAKDRVEFIPMSHDRGTDLTPCLSANSSVVRILFGRDGSRQYIGNCPPTSRWWVATARPGGRGGQMERGALGSRRSRGPETRVGVRRGVAA